jgi:hypothetical protein
MKARSLIFCVFPPLSEALASARLRKHAKKARRSCRVSLAGGGVVSFRQVRELSDGGKPERSNATHDFLASHADWARLPHRMIRVVAKSRASQSLPGQRHEAGKALGVQ